jgi:hypothetical protein
MSTQISTNASFLRTSRDFPEEMHGLAREVNKSYIEIADRVNTRVIGLYTVTRASITGESWYLLNNQKQQTFRQVFIFTSTASINHGIQIIDKNQFTLCSGSYTDGTNSYGLPFGTSTTTPGLITFFISPTQIVFSLGAGAPTLTAGRIVLEWLYQP